METSNDFLYAFFMYISYNSDLYFLTPQYFTADSEFVLWLFKRRRFFEGTLMDFVSGFWLFELFGDVEVAIMDQKMGENDI